MLTPRNLKVPGLGSEYQVHLARDEESGRDSMKLIVERGQGVDAARVPELIKETIYQMKKQLLVTPDVEVVAYGGLPRSEKKSQRIFDTRIQDEIV